MIKKPKKCITVADAKKIENNYVKIIEKALKKELGKEQCRDFWWSIEEIEEYIAYVKEEAAKKDYKNLGLRFYLGKYEKDKDDEVTMFIAPTQNAESSVNEKSLLSASSNENIYDIEPMNFNQGGWPPKEY